MYASDARAPRTEFPDACPGFVRYWLVAALLIAGGATLVARVTALPRPLNYPHAWASADLALQARSFQQVGVIGLRGIPFSNNLPFGIRKEPYLHWPPLLPILLSFVFRLFGDSEASMHGFMLAIQVATAFCIYLWARVGIGPVGGAFALLAWLSQAVVLKYSFVVVQPNPAILFMVLSILVFMAAAKASRRRFVWMAAAAGVAFCGVLFSWEAVLVPVGLMAGSFWVGDRGQRRVALVMLASGIVAALSVLGWYALMYPDLARDTFNTVAYRMGLGDVRSNDPIYHLDQRAGYPYLPLSERVAAIWQFLSTTVGALPLLAIAVYVCAQSERSPERSGDPSIAAFAGLLAPPLIWFTVFSNHAANHEFQYLLAAPCAAFAIGWCADAALRFLAAGPRDRTRVRMWALVVAGPILLVIPIVLNAASMVRSRSAVMTPGLLAEFGRAIGKGTEAGAVVLTPELNEVPIYYSHRHVIAGVATDEDTKRLLPLVRANFPGAPLYLAFYRDGQAVIVKLAR